MVQGQVNVRTANMRTGAQKQRRNPAAYQHNAVMIFAQKMRQFYQDAFSSPHHDLVIVFPAYHNGFITFSRISAAASAPLPL